MTGAEKVLPVVVSVAVIVLDDRHPSIANVVFIVVCWYGLRPQWPFAVVMVVAFGVWAALVTVPYVVRRAP